MSDASTGPTPLPRYRFGTFEVDAATGELRRQGLRVKLNTQPFQVLLMLLARPGELLTREEISRELWPQGTFVDYEHGINSTVNRIREALGDTAARPRFVETLARRGYRFLAPVEKIVPGEIPAASVSESLPLAEILIEKSPTNPEPAPRTRILATPQELPTASHAVVQTLYVLFQLMYLGFYVGALCNLAEIDDLLSPLPHASAVFYLLIVTAAILIPVRAFMLTGALFRPPAAREKLLKLWPILLLFDEVWSLSPFLLLHHINMGLALACTTLLVYSPFAQRSLVLMGAAAEKPSPYVPIP
jgi:DNA-binding winged helix-turn-helix (wHTH) protein